MASPIHLAFAGAVAAIVAGLPGQDAGPPPRPVAGLEREIELPLHDGEVSLLELGRALFDAYDLDGDVLRFRDRSIDVGGARGSLLLLGARKLLLDTVRFRKVDGGRTLVLRIDRERTREVRRRLRARAVRFVGQLLGEDLTAREYALALPAKLDPGRPLVVLVHGVESSPRVWADLSEFLARDAAELQVATFAYPNDEAIEVIAPELGVRLRALGEQRVTIVGHSMGGLVARWMLEHPRTDPGNVTMLILVGTPNRGSNLAGLRFALEAAPLLRSPRGTASFGDALLDGILANLTDGLGEAGGDLLPDSVFLNKLAAGARNPDVDYRMILGTKSVLKPEQLATVRRVVLARLERTTVGELFAPKIEHWLDDLGELVDGEGDGAVSVARARLDGVETVLVPLDHVALIKRRGIVSGTPAGDDHPVFRQIVKWIE